MEQELEQWCRARSLYREVLGLGIQSPHRADALYHLGWCEYRLGNRSEARSHFGAFLEGYPHDPRRGEAESMAIVCRTEELHAQARAFSRAPGGSAEQAAREKLNELVTYIDRHHVRVQNKAYRSILQEIALSAGLELIDQYEESGAYRQADEIYSALRRIQGISCPDTTLRDTISHIVLRHLKVAPEHPASETRRARARVLIGRIASDLSGTA